MGRQERSDGLSFTWMGFPIQVRYTFFMMAGLLAVSGGQTSASAVATWLVIVFVSVLWHELGHAVAARRFGLAAEIELHAMGGLTHHTAVRERSFGAELVIAVAGPAAGFLLGGAVWLIAWIAPPESHAAQQAVRSALWVNVGWGLVNLLPVLPYDGGLALRAILDRLAGGRGEWTAQVVSAVVGASACGAALIHRMPWAAYLAGAASIRAAGELVRLRWARRLDHGWAALFAGRPREASLEADRVLGARADDATGAHAVELLAWTRLYDADVPAARDALVQLPESHRPSPLLRATLDLLEGQDAVERLRTLDADLLAYSWLTMVRGWIAQKASRQVERLVTERTAPVLSRETLHALDALLFYAAEYDDAALVASRSFTAHGHPEDAYNIACSLARKGQFEEAVGWLERAIDAGYQDLAHLLADEDLAEVRRLPAFDKIEERLSRLA